MSKKTIRIRLLTEADAETFAAFRREITVEDELARVELPLDDELRRSFEAFRAELPLPEPNTVLGAFLNGELVGVTVVVGPGVLSPSQDSANLWGMFVLPRVRGHGIGQLLVRQTVARTFGLGIPRIQLQLLRPNEAALRLYRSQGFEVCEPDAHAVYFPGSYKNGIHLQIHNSQAKR